MTSELIAEIQALEAELKAPRSYVDPWDHKAVKAQSAEVTAKYKKLMRLTRQLKSLGKPVEEPGGIILPGLPGNPVSRCIASRVTNQMSLIVPH